MTDAEFRADAPVIIVGAGPVGLSLALGLARYDVKSILLEQRNEEVNESRAIVIWTRTQEIMRDWGAYASLRAAGDFFKEFRAINARTEATMIDVDFRYVEDIVDDPGVLIIPQYETERTLRRLVETNPACTIRQGVRVSGVTQDTRLCTVRISGPAGEGVLRAQYVVGCDGAGSVTRRALGLALEGITYDSRVVLSDDRIEQSFDPEVRVRAVLDQPGLLGAIRFAPNLWRVMASVPKDTPDELALSSAAHLARIERIFGAGVVANTTWSSIFNLHRRHAQRFSVGRIALAGDAAHINSPAGGQGMNAGIQDAANLAWKLAAVLGGHGDGNALFETYQTERIEMVTGSIERYTDQITRLALGFPSRFRKTGVRMVVRVVRGRGIQRKLCRALGMLSGRYTKSPIVDARHPLAGRRIDDLRLADGVRINALRNGNAVLVGTGDADTGDLHIIHLSRAPKRWHVKSPVVLIVRPDGCVAAVVSKPTRAKIEAAWSAAFLGTIPLPTLTTGSAGAKATA